MEEKSKGFLKKFAIGAVVVAAALGAVVGGIFGAKSCNDEKSQQQIVTPEPDPTTPIEPDEPVKEPGTPIEEPDEPPVEEPDPTPELEPDPEEPIDEPDTPIEEPDEPEPDEPPVEEQAREDMIFFDDTDELNSEGFHKALMYIMENYESLGMTLEEIFYGRVYDDYNFFAVNWNEEDNNIYMFSNCELKNSTNGNDKEINITSLNDIDLRSAEYGNSIEKFVDKIMNNDRISINNVYRLAYHHTEDDLDSLEDYYAKAYQMAEHRIEQELNRNEIVIGSFITARTSVGAGLGLGDSDAISTHYWVLNERTNKITEVTVSVVSSSVLGKGFEENLMDCPITGNDYVKFDLIAKEDVATIEPKTLYNVEDSKIINTKSANTKSSVKTDKYAFVVDDKYYEL